MTLESLLLLSFMVVSVAATSIANGTSIESHQPRPALNATLNLEALSLFHIFIVKYGKVYQENTFHTKFKVFQTNLAVIKARNEEEERAGGSAVHGITRFADLTEEEFANQYLSAGFSDDFDTETETVTVEPHVGTATAMNWIYSYTTPVRDQGINMASLLLLFHIVSRLSSQEVATAVGPFR